ncbi:aminotransferase-like domain-containing protein [Frigidibacter sp. MR17.24]|uniref:aminotransferase-like domain-containing protein n=1 Tax=Frigidibacter sp. MR17.24 TaxID=3127345 RepID=UPI003012DD22
MTGTTWRPDLSLYDGPKYLALARALRDAVRDGALGEGEKLPPVRELAWRIGVTPGTVARAYTIGTDEGLLEAAVGRGTFVAARAPRLGPSQSLHIERPEPLPGRDLPVDLRSPQLPDVGQGAALTDAMGRVAGTLGADWLEYPSLRRDLPLRAAIVAWMAGRDLGPLDADDIVCSHGGQSAINIVLQCCLRGDRPVLMGEELAYPGFRHAARLNRAEMVPVALDANGIRPDALDQACRRQGGRILFVTPEAQNPTTVRMPVDRRIEIVRIARAHDVQIIEDDCYSVPGVNVPSLRALAPERVWHVSSLSKSLSAGLRIGWVVAPEGMGEAGRLAAQHSFFGLARPMTDIVTDLLTSGRAAELRDRINTIYARRLDMVVAAFKGYDVSWQPGLSFLWLKMPLGWRASTFAREAESAGVLVRSADEYALQDGHAPNAIRIALAGGVPEEQFARALSALRRLLGNPPGDLPV